MDRSSAGATRLSLATAALAVFCALLWQSASVHCNYAGNWSALFCTGGIQRVPPDLAAGTYRFQHPYGYDGQFYRYIAHDPLFRKGYSAFIDDARLRYRRLLVPMLAWVLAAGRPQWIDFTFIAVVLASIGMGVYWSSRYAVLHRRHPGWGLVFLLLPATLSSMDRMLVDATLAALFAGFLVAAEQRSERTLYILCLLACLTRETGFLIAGACVLYRLIERRYAAAAWFASATVPALAWYGFVALHTAPSQASNIVTWPLLGLLRRLFTIRSDPVLGTALQAIDALAVLGLLASFVLAGYWGWRKPGPVRISVFLFLGLGLVLGSPNHMIEGFGYGRPVSPLLLFVSLEAIRTGAWFAMAPLLLITVSVGVYFASPLLGILQKLGS